ncbi:ATP-binding protein [Chrysanthemum yellows phytoplasma]|uniref:ATP-binding protein n=1 Tax=Chrysanthemum yellows phytoplasma TaxID=238674 RepID=UPI00068EF28B|nr:ATP-binding protein [Chrysanthemum yellows phytoplasma]
MESVIDQLQGFLNYLSDPLSYVGVGKVKPPQGVLFYGVPGTGKTFFTRALAKEAGRQVGFYETNAAEFVYQTLVGDGPRFVKKLFEDVRLHNKKEGVKASIIFIDECEEAFKYLNKTANSSSDLPNVVNQFKTELTSTKNDPKKPILIIGATNYFDKIDEAIKSRFTYHIEIKVGHATARAKYLDLMINVLRKNPFHEEALEYLLKTVNPFLDKFDAESRSNRRLENMIESSVINMNNRLSAESRAKQKEIDDKTKKLQLEANTLSLSQEEKDQLQKDIQELKTQLHNRKIKLEQIVENESQMAQIKQQETKIEKETAEKKAQQIILEEKIAKLNFEIEFLQEELNKLNEKQSQPKPLQPPTSSTLQTSESNASSTLPQDVTPTSPNSEQQPQQPNPEAEKLKQQTKDKQKEKEELLQKEDPLKLEEDITKLVQKLAQLDQEKNLLKQKLNNYKRT